MRFNKRKRSVLVLSLLFLIMINLVSEFTVNAVTINEATQSDIKIAITDRLKRLTVTNNSYKDDRGLVYSLTSLINVTMWLDFATHNPIAEFRSNELEVYYKYISTGVDRFNSTYGAEAEGLNHTLQLSLPAGTPSTIGEYKTFADSLLTDLISKAGSVGDNIYATLLNNYNSKSDDDEKKKYLESDEARPSIKAVYQMAMRVGQEKDDVLSLCTLDNSRSSNTYIYSRDITAITSIITKSEYNVLVDKARELVELDIMQAGEDSPIEGDNARDRYLDTIDGKTQVNTHWIKAFACSAIYRPFESVVGETPFIEALKEMDSDDLAVDTYNSIATKRKPLYFVKVSGSSNEFDYKDNAERITVKEFLDAIESDGSGALVLPKGQFQRSQDSDAFAVRQKDGIKVYDDNGELAKDGDSSSSTFKEKTQEEIDKMTDEEKKKYEEDKKNAESSSSKGSGVKMEDEELGEFILDQKVSMSSGYMMDKPVFVYGSKQANATMNKIMLYNLIKDNKSIDTIDQLDKRFLYMNPFGDILLDDGTVVVPGAANATFYKDDRGIVYNPNTAAFMNCYPRASLNSEYFSVTDRDEGKYIVSMTGNHATANNEESDSDNYDQDTVGPTITTQTKATSYIIAGNKEGLKTAQFGDNSMPIELKIFNGGTDKIQTMRAINFKFNFHWSSFGSGVRTGSMESMIVPDTSTLMPFGNSANMFPLTGEPTDKSFIERCKYLATKMYDSMDVDETGTVVGLNGRYDRQWLTDVFEEGYKGTMNISGFVKNSIQEYNDLDESGKFISMIRTWAQKTLDTLGQTPGVVGLRNAYQDPIFGKLLFYSKQFLGIILVVIVVFFVIKFQRKRVNAVYATFGVVFSVIVTYLALMIIPVYMPIFLNGLINNVSDDLAYNALFMREERYDDPFETEVGYDDQGNFSLGVSAINLYRMYPDDLINICNELGVDEEDLTSGTAYVIDSDSGLFVQGDLIKLNLDRLFASLSIVGSYSEDSIINTYKLTSKKYLSNVLDYYTPYYLMVDSFIEKLNKFSQLYNIPPSQLQYPYGIYKDSFMVNTYIQSDLFLNGDNLEILKDQFSEDLYNNAVQPSMFGSNNLDFLGLQNTFISYVSNNLDKVKDTVWFQTMVRQGYYDETGSVLDDDKFAKLIEKTNRIVKQFLIKHRGDMSYISDENMIKCTVLYALTEINRQISNFNDNVYPQALNYEELKLEDILLPVLTKDYDRYMAQDQKIVNYIESDFGILGLLFFMVICVESWFITNVMGYGMPILYIILLLCIIVRLVKKDNEELNMVLSGYFKVFGAIYACYFSFCLLTSFAKRFNDTVWTMFVLIIVYSIFITIMGTVLSALLLSGFDFGSSRVNASLRDLGEKALKKTHLDGLFMKGKQIIQRIKPEELNRDMPNYRDKYRRYSYSTSVDDIYGDEILADVMDSRHQGFKSKYGSGENENKHRKRHRHKKGNVREDYRLIEDDEDEMDDDDFFINY